MKVITLNYENSKGVKFTSLRRMILQDNTPLNVHNPKKVKRKHGGGLVSDRKGKQIRFF